MQAVMNITMMPHVAGGMISSICEFLNRRSGNLLQHWQYAIPLKQANAPPDVNQRAKSIVDRVTSEAAPEPQTTHDGKKFIQTARYPAPKASRSC
jgi:hypothetical protein